MITVFISLGTNLGDRLINLKTAIKALPPQVKPLEQSRVYNTAPWGYSEQPDFLNQVVKGETSLDPAELLIYLKGLEEALGRVPTFRFGPRLIDIDLLFYEDLVMESPDLVIPHPRLHERPFVLAPLADLSPDFVHPKLGKTVRQMLAEVGHEGVVHIDNGE
jgi:2-amino-4-hydroxy-6-hydroxymethyldihydropteridine diphosphokinase